jgi:hypothetical protein
MMILEKEPRDFSQEFLTQNYSIRLFDIFHQINALLLQPENEAIRAKIILSLNIDFFYKTRKENNDSNFIAALKYILQIPDESYLVNILRKLILHGLLRRN